MQATGMDITPSSGYRSPENPRNPLYSIFDIEPTYTGKTVTETTAMQVTAVWACVRILSGAVARTPVCPWRKTPEGKQKAEDHYLYPLLTYSANPFLSAVRFQRLMQAWVLLWGNAYAEIEINGRGQVIALWPWRPDRVRVEVTGTGKMFYHYMRLTGETVMLSGEDIFHLRGLELDGMMGLSPIQQARQSIGLAMAAEEYGARFFGNNGRPGAVLEHPARLSDAAQKNLRDSWENVHRGLQGAHRIGILEEGMKLHEVGIPPEDAQFLQTRNFQVIDICRLFGVPPHMVAELTRATFSNIEHQGLQFANDSVDDWFVNWESEIGHQLLSRREAQTVFVQFDRSKLTVGDYKSRAEGHAIYRQNGVLNANEIRDDLGRNPVEGGEEYIIQLNMQNQESLPEKPGEPADEGVDDEAA
jgi:HK97 family phage portal protein